MCGCMQLVDSADPSADACVSQVLGGNNLTDPLVLGDPFLQWWYSVYNAIPDGSSVQLAPSAFLPTAASS